MNPQIQRSSRSRAGRTGVWIYLLLLSVHLTVTRGHFGVTDEVITYETTRSLVERGSLDVPSAGLHATYQGKDGRSYGVYSIGDSVALTPFYFIGRAVDRFCESHRLASWNVTFGTREMSYRTEWRWGGTTEIFFVGLFNAFIVAGIGTLFYFFQLRLGCSRNWAAIGALGVGLASEIAGLSSSLYEHPPESLLLLAVLYALAGERERPGPARRIAAGCLAGLLILVRLQAAVALPAMTLYLVHNIFQRSPGTSGERLRRLARPLAEFVAPVAAAIFINCWIHEIESGAWTLIGGYGDRPSPFTGPLSRGLFGYFLSPGESIFLFTPLLLLVPAAFRHFPRRFRPEAIAIGGIFACYVLVHADLEYWHGLWCYGPRYLAATIPLLLLPLPMWLEKGGARRRVAAAGLALAGIWMQATSLLVNYAYIFFAEGYVDANPPDSFLFDWRRSPVVTHSRALLTWSKSVDFWLLNVHYYAGAARMWELLLPLAAAIAACSVGLVRSLRQGELQGP